MMTQPNDRKNPYTDASDYKKGLLLLRIYLKAMVFAFTGGLAATPQLLYEITKKHKSRCMQSDVCR